MRRLPVEPFEPEPDEDGEADDPDVQTADEVEAEREPPPLRSRDYKPGHRVPKVKPTSATPAGPSPWERPRDGFTEAMASRSPEMSNTRQGRWVNPRIHDA